MCILVVSGEPAVFVDLYCEEFLVNHIIVNCCCLRFGICSTSLVTLNASIQTFTASFKSNSNSIQIRTQYNKPLYKGHDLQSQYM